MECLITGLGDEFSFLLLRFWTYTFHVLEYDKLIIKVLLVPSKKSHSAAFRSIECDKTQF